MLSYSARSASTGSTRDVLRDGTYAAGAAAAQRVYAKSGFDLHDHRRLP